MIRESRKKSPHPMCRLCGHEHRGLEHVWPGRSKTNSPEKASELTEAAGSNPAGRGVAKAAAGLGARAPVAKNAGGKAKTVAQQEERRLPTPKKPKLTPSGLLNTARNSESADIGDGVALMSAAHPKGPRKKPKKVLTPVVPTNLTKAQLEVIVAEAEAKKAEDREKVKERVARHRDRKKQAAISRSR